MDSTKENVSGKGGGRGRFPQTRWSLVVAVRDQSSAIAMRALAELCQTYWFPLYVYVRRRGYSAHDAEDLTQSFFARLLEHDDLSSANREKGKLRSFLLGALKHFLADEWDKANAKKRGGGSTVISIDAEVEARYRLDPTEDTDSPDVLFEKRWAQTVLEQARQRLETDYQTSGKRTLFETLHPFLAWNTSDGGYDDAAQTLGITANAARVAVFRMRKRYAETLREVIADTVTHPDEVAQELQYLFRVIRK